MTYLVLREVLVLAAGAGGDEPLTVAALQQDDARGPTAGLGVVIEQQVL